MILPFDPESARQISQAVDARCTRIFAIVDYLLTQFAEMSDSRLETMGGLNAITQHADQINGEMLSLRALLISAEKTIHDLQTQRDQSALEQRQLIARYEAELRKAYQRSMDYIKHRHGIDDDF